MSFEPIRFHRPFFTLLSLGILIGSGCSSWETGVYKEGLVTESGEPAYVKVQHCLISFNEVPEVNTNLTREQAEQLAQELFQQAKEGENFDRIVVRHTNDSAPGIYRMANRGYDSDTSSLLPGNKVYARDDMAISFGDVGFSLDVGEVGMAPFDPDKSPFGWHIIKRLE
jgi:hypothetical protein